jgi:hypothetical protein
MSAVGGARPQMVPGSFSGSRRRTELTSEVKSTCGVEPLERSPVQPHDRRDDRQPQPGAARRARQVQTRKGFDDAGKLASRHAWTFILEAEHRLPVADVQTDIYLRAGGRVLDGVFEKVGHSQTDKVAVANEHDRGRERDFERTTGILDIGPIGVGHQLDPFAQVEGRKTLTRTPCFDFGKTQHCIEQAQ